MSAPDQDLAQYCRTVAENAHKASAQLQLVSGELKNRWLNESAQALRAGVPAILAANANDIEAAPGYGLTDAQIDRLVLNEERIDGIATALEQISMLPDPIGQTIEGSVRPNGLEINKVRVPLGVVFFIYESRPNVTADAAAICLKSGNAVILRGGKEAARCGPTGLVISPYKLTLVSGPAVHQAVSSARRGRQLDKRRGARLPGRPRARWRRVVHR